MRKHAIARAKKDKKSKRLKKTMLKLRREDPLLMDESTLPNGFEMSIDDGETKSAAILSFIEWKKTILGDCSEIKLMGSELQKALCIKITHGEKLAGFILFDGEYIHTLNILDPYKGRGLGKFLVAFAKKANYMGRGPSYLHVVGSEDSVGFWRKLGCRTMSLHPSGDIDFYLSIGEFNEKDFESRRIFIELVNDSCSR